MIKIVCLLRKKPGLSSEEFREYYENHHVKLFEESLAGAGAIRYTRRYLEPIPDPISGVTRQSGVDVIMEIWCDEDVYRSSFGSRPPDEFRDLVAADEAKLFDRDHIFIHIADEQDTDLDGIRSRQRSS